MKKGNKSITKYVLRIKVIFNSLLGVGYAISNQYQIDFILASLQEEYNMFVM